MIGCRSRSVALLFLLTASVLRAELPSPRLDRISPLGTAAGSSVEIEITGTDLEDAQKLYFDHPGLKGEFVADRRFKVLVDANVPPGTYDLFVFGKYGISNPRLFVVSSGFTELAEKEPNDEASQAQPIALDSIINGTSDNNREDLYRLSLKKGQRVVLECGASRYESLMNATMTLSTADGRQLAGNGGYNGRDPLIDFIAPSDGNYLLSVYDLSYRGGRPYRLTVSTKPHLENVFPRAVRAGKETKLTLFGRNFGPSGKQSSFTIQDQPLDERIDPFTAPKEIEKFGRFVFHEHPTHHSPAPTAATCTLTGMQYRGSFDGFLTDAIPLIVCDEEVTLEAEPNDDSKKPQVVSLPLMLSGRFDHERDADWFEFETSEDGPHLFEVYCERIAGRADPYLVLLDEKGNRISEYDDYGHRMNAFDGHLRDPWGLVNLTKKKKYRVLVQDRYRRGGARYQYVLSIRRSTPDFFAAAIHHQNPGPGGLNLRKGGTTHLDLIIHHKDGLNAPITVTAEGLPRGVHFQPTTITGDNRGSLILWADRDAEDFIGPIRLVATSKRGDAELIREVRPYCRCWNDPSLGSSRPMRQLMLAVGETSPFQLKPEKDRVEIAAGSKLSLRIELERGWDDFRASVNLIPHGFPGPIKMANVSIPEGKAEATVNLDVQANAKPGEYTLCLMGQAQVPFAKPGKEPKGGAKTNTLVSLPSRPITIVVKPATPTKK